MAQRYTNVWLYTRKLLIRVKIIWYYIKDLCQIRFTSSRFICNANYPFLLRDICIESSITKYWAPRRVLSTIKVPSNFGPIPNSLHIFQVHSQYKFSFYYVILRDICIESSTTRHLAPLLHLQGLLNNDLHIRANLQSFGFTLAYP